VLLSSEVNGKGCTSTACGNGADALRIFDEVGDAIKSSSSPSVSPLRNGKCVIVEGVICCGSR
jgi:hypothetical protein